MINAQHISLSKLEAVFLPDLDKALDRVVGSTEGSHEELLATTLTAQMMSYGFIPSKKLHHALTGLKESALYQIYEDVLPLLREMKGAHVKHKPMYVNFPRQVMEMSEVELYLNALIHYWSFGEWKPDYPELPRHLAFETVKWRELDVVGDEQLNNVFTQLLSSNDSISDSDKQILTWFMNSGRNLQFPDVIPFKENLCFVAGMFLESGKPIDGMVKTATDVLRIITSLSGGDISLAANTRFKSLSRPQRRMFCQLLEKVANLEDINRHRNKWVRLFHELHVGDYSDKLHEMAAVVRNNQPIRTFNGRVNAALNDKDVETVVSLLQQRPGEFARRLDHLFRIFDDHDEKIIESFLHVASKIPTRILCQVMAHLQTRMDDSKERVVFPKGNTQKAQIIPALPTLRRQIVNRLDSELERILLDRFSSGEKLGKVWVDPQLALCPVPSGQRSASPGARQVARGTYLPFGDETKNTLRFFIYWVGQDIDLSATLHDENFKMIERIGYTNLRSHQYESCHSGDITRAPDGASEFIDITIEQAVKAGARYVVMNVFVFRGPNFSEHETCFAGWMTRSKPKSNEIYDAKTVEGKVDLCSQSRNAIPVVFDLVERKAIWCDLATKRNVSWDWTGGGFSTGWRGQGNNVENNRASIEQTLKAIVATSNSRFSLHRLFQLHAQARGVLVENRQDADTVFALNGENAITPYDIMRINSEFIA